MNSSSKFYFQLLARVDQLFLMLYNKKNLTKTKYRYDFFLHLHFTYKSQISI